MKPLPPKTCVAVRVAATAASLEYSLAIAVAFALSDLAVSVEAARLLTYKAAALKDAGRPAAQVKQAAAYFQSALAVEGVTEEARKAAQQGVQQTSQQ